MFCFGCWVVGFYRCALLYGYDGFVCLICGCFDWYCCLLTCLVFGLVCNGGWVFSVLLT